MCTMDKKMQPWNYNLGDSLSSAERGVCLNSFSPLQSGFGVVNSATCFASTKNTQLCLHSTHFCHVCRQHV